MKVKDWTGLKVKCIDPVETDMFEGDLYLIKRDYGDAVGVHIKGLDRFYLKSRFDPPK